MPKLPTLTSQQVVKIIERKGFVIDRTKGSHHTTSCFFCVFFYVFFYVSDLIPRTKVVICEQEKFWPFWLWPKAALGIPVFIAPPCRATAIFLESESPFVFSLFRVFSVFRG